MRWSIALPLLLFAASCLNTPPVMMEEPLPMCDARAGGAAPLFVDATAAWGMSAVVGNRITSADLDGDGYPDLIVHAISTNLRETIGTPPKLVNVLMNRPSSDGKSRQFVDATQDSGVFQTRDGSTTQYRSAQLAIAADVDNDGDLDLWSGTYVDPNKPMTDPGDRSELLLNDGAGHFTLAPISDPHPGPMDYFPTTGATFTDVDRDGKIDLFVGFWYESYGFSYTGVQAQLYRGAGDGTFATVTDGAGLTTDEFGYDTGTNHRPAYGVTSCDLDGDGAPELLVSAYGRQWNLLYRNDGAGAFTEIGQASGYAADGNLDYKDNEFFKCYCTLHTTQADCVGVAKPKVACGMPADALWSAGTDDQPWRLGGNTFTTWCGDLDGDGRPDLYSAEIHHWHIGQSSDGSELLRNATIANSNEIKFDRPGNDATGMKWPHPTSDWNEGGIMAAGGDLDGDGRTDMIAAASDYPDQYSLLFHQKPDQTFEEVGEAWGLHHFCASGLTLADLDRDGDLDVVVGSGTARDCAKTWTKNEVHVYENQGNGARYLLVKLRGDGTTTNRGGVGAKVTVTVGNPDKVQLVQELGAGYGHMAMQNDTVLHFGLGACATVESVTVRWPDQAGTTETWKRVGTNRFVELRQGDTTKAYDVELK